MPDLPISGLPSASVASQGDILPIVQGGTTEKITAGDLGRGIFTFNLPLTASGGTFSGDIVPTTPQGANLGSLTQPFREIYLQSGSINIESDIPDGRRANISNADGNVTIEAAGFQLKSGSFIPFEISETARVQIKVPQIPAGDIGAFSVIGNTSGLYQSVTSPGGMVHITGNDGQANRLNLDSFGSGSTTSFNGIIGRSARGTVAAPSQSKAGDVILRLTSTGWRGDTGFGGATIVGGSTTTLDFIALEDQMDAARGSAQQFYNAPIGTRNRVLCAQIDASGLFVSGALSASLQQNYVWLGNSSNRSAAVPLSTLAVSGGFWTSGSEGNFGFYGAFCSTGSQTNPVGNVSRSMQLETTEHSNGVSIISGSRITVANKGVYNLQFSAQLEKTNNGVDIVYIWFKKNGSNVPRSNTSLDVAKQAGGSGRLVAAWNYVDTMNIGDYLEIIWQSADTNMILAYDPASGNYPSIPSAIVTLTQVG
jgi:hypothetical protein